MKLFMTLILLFNVDIPMLNSCRAINNNPNQDEGSQTSTAPSSPNSIDCSAGCEFQIKIRQVWFQEPSGYDRTADVRVPATAVKLPVVIDLHGSGGIPRVKRFGRFLEKSIIVAPAGYENVWNIVTQSSKAPDLEFIEELFKKISEIEQANMDDVTIIGTSNGAALITRILLETDTRKIKRVILIANYLKQRQYHDRWFWKPSEESSNLGPNIYDEAVVPVSPGPEFIYFHGTADERIPYNGGSFSSLTLLGAQPSTYAFAQAFGYTGPLLDDSEAVVEQPGAVKYEYNGASRVVHYKMEGMEHSIFHSSISYLDFIIGLIKEKIEG